MESARRYQSEFILWLLALAISPWPLGSNRDWAWPVLTLLIGLASITVVATTIHVRSLHAKLMIIGFAALILYMLLQWTGLLLTVDQFQTQNEVLKTLTYGLFFFLTLRLLSSESRIRMALYCVILIALLEALFGGVQQLIYGVDRSNGSFANPNHYAGYLEMSIGLAIGAMLAAQAPQHEQRSLSVIEWATGVPGRLRIIIVILVIALVMSRSRMGNVAFFTSVLITAGIAFYYSRQINRYTAGLVISILIIDAFIVSNYFGLDRLQQRIENIPAEESARIDLITYNLNIVDDHPMFGTGAGSYETAFTPYRDGQMTKKPVHAETDYAELLVELGLVGVLPLCLILITGIHAQVRLLSKNASHFERGIAFGCLCGTISILIHGFVDVNLQIPSNSLLFMLLLSLPVCLIEQATQTSAAKSTST